MADRRVQIRGSQMKLIDILREIKNTKKELKSILDENNDFARYPITIHNVLAEIYNRYYVNGYHDMWYESTQESKYCESPRELLEYVVDDKNYDPWTTEGLTDIMSDVCGYRVEMKNEDKLNTDSDYFPSYPSLLRIALTEMEELGYEDGQNAAYSIIHTEPPTILQPTFEWDDDTNTFTISTTQENVTLWYMIGNENSPKMIYTNPVELNEDVTIFYYASIGKYKSEIYSYDCENNIYNTVQRRAPASPNISFNGGATITINSSSATDQIYYAIGQVDADKILYRGAFDLPANTNTVVYAWAVNGCGWSETSSLGVQTWSSAPGITDEGWNGTTINGVPVIQYQCASPMATYAAREATDPFIWTITCDTEDATIYYLAVEGTAIPEEWTWTEYDGPITLNIDGTLYAYAAAEGYTDSQIVRYVTYAATAPVVRRPGTPIFQYEVYTLETGLKIIPREYCGIMYSFGPPQDFDNDSCWMIDDSGSSIVLHPEIDCVVYAKSFKLDDPTLQSNYVTYDYKNGFSKVLISAPVMTRIDNAVTIEYTKVEGHENWTYELRYTIDGSDPKTGRKWGWDENHYGIPITQENTVIKAIIRVNDGQYYSKITTAVFDPVEGSNMYEDMFFTVHGATEINISQNTNGQNNSNNNFSWSYDLINWNVCYYWSVTGLDPTRNVYIYSTHLGDWITMTFGSEDEVTVSGNILTLVYGDSVRESLNNNIRITSNIPTEWERTMQFRQLFKGATTLVDASNLYIPDFESKGRDFEEMFMGCTALKYGPTFLPKNIGLYSCKSMFEGCTSLLSLKSLSINTIDDYGCQLMFSGCKELLLGADFELTSIGIHGMEDAFYGCTKLLDITLTLTGNMTDYCFNRCFKNCYSLNSDKIHLNSINVGFYSCNEMFMNCRELTSSTSLNSLQLANSCYASMFEGCTTLNTVGQIAATEGAQLAMKRMFAGCTSLTTAPTIRFTELRSGVDTNVMYQMFDGCEMLNYIKIMWLTDPLPTDNENTAKWTRQWVRGVAPSGTFEMDDDAQWLHISESAIPRGWRVIGALNLPGIILNISLQNMDEVVITSSNDDEIRYWINGADTQMSETTELYTGPFVVDHSVHVSACCINNRGTRGPIEGKDIVIALPEIVFSRVGNYISLSSTPAYDQIHYTLSTEADNVDHLYTGDIPITTNTSIHAWGITSNGTRSETFVKIFDLDLGRPNGVCENNIVTLSLPSGSPERSDIKYYVYTPGSSDKGIAHIYDAPFLITEDKVIEAYVYWFNGTEYVTGEDALVFTAIWDEEGYSYLIDTPVFNRMYNDTTNYNQNIVYCIYGNNKMYKEQIPEDIHVYYKINNGTTQEWIFKSLYETSYGTQLLLTEDSDIETWASDGTVSSPHATYHFDFITGQTVVTIPAPVIEVVGINGNYGQYRVRISNEDPEASCYFMVDTEGTVHQLNNGGTYILEIDQTIDEFTVYAWSTKNGFESETVDETFDNTNQFIIYRPLNITSQKIGDYTCKITINPDLRNPANSELWYAVMDEYHSTNNPEPGFKYMRPFEIVRNSTIYAWTRAQDIYGNYIYSEPIYRYITTDTNDYIPSLSRYQNTITLSGDTAQGVRYEYSLNGLTYVRCNVGKTFNIPERGTLRIYARSYSNGGYSDIIMNSYTFDPQYVVIDAPTITYVDDVITITNNEPSNTNYVLKYKIDDGDWYIYTGPIIVAAGHTVYARNIYYDNRYAESSYNTTSFATEYLTFVALEDNTRFYFGSTGKSFIYEYSFDNGNTWTERSVDDNDSSTFYINYRMNTGDKIMVRGNNETYEGIEIGLMNYSTGWMDKEYYVEGNIMSLIYGDDFVGKTILPTYGCFNGVGTGKGWFEGFIVSAENLVLPATTLTDACYAYMFVNDGHLVTPPKLPATTLAGACYKYMFYNCGALTTAPELPATTLTGWDVYYGMFEGCTSLTTSPSLPATTLTDRCYWEMFYGCSNLTTAPAILPATTLASGCYQMMFMYCTKLETAPELPAPSLLNVEACYQKMFNGCTMLNYIKMLAINNLTLNINDWVWGVSSTGRFIKSELATLPYGEDGIPTGWTVENV